MISVFCRSQLVGRFSGNSRAAIKLSLRLCSSSMSVSSLLSASDAVSLASNPNVQFVDASFHMDKARNVEKEFLTERIDGAVRFDIDSVCDKNSNLPHMLPSEEQFNTTMNGMNINNDCHVVVYGSKNSIGAPRVWWMFKVFGHQNVSILDGGLEAWKEAGGPVGTGPATAAQNHPSRSIYKATRNNSMVAGVDEVLVAVQKGSSQIADARSLARFKGDAPEPREGLRSGSIPGSICIPFTSLVSAEDTTKFKSLAEINKIFKENDLVYGSRIILSCGSGVTACFLHFALHLMGAKLEAIPVYDGSWTQWGADDSLPIVGPSA